MSDEVTSATAPTSIPVSQAPETPISTTPEAVIAPAPVEAPVAPVPTPEPIPESSSGHLGGNDPIEVAPAESIPPVLAETPAPEVQSPTEITQPTPAEPVIEATPVAQVETPAPVQIPEPIIQAKVSEPTSTPVATTTPTPAQGVATVVAPIVATTITQVFTKSMRELFTKALNARQNKKRKKLDRIPSLFAKQTMITNNEVEKLLHVSDSTATRYLATLTKEGKLKQNIKKGQATSYSKI